VRIATDHSTSMECALKLELLCVTLLADLRSSLECSALVVQFTT